VTGDLPTDALTGCLLGTAVGDSLGLPYEGVSRRRAAKLFPGPLRHRFVFRRGMISDDTEHSLFVAQALLAHPESPDAFAKSLAWKLRWWFLGLPAGVGLATIRACLKLWLGFPPAKSGVRSAGNGPAMRTALLGAYFGEDEDALRRHVEAATIITHRDPRALTGAMAVAVCAQVGAKSEASARPDVSTVLERLKNLAPSDGEWVSAMDKLSVHLASDRAVLDFADSLSLQRGVTGYIYHTVPVTIYAWLRHWGDFRSTLEAVVRCGGDADTTGAIAGALAGATVGLQGIPAEWLDGIKDWPRSTELLREVAGSLVGRKGGQSGLGPVGYPWPAVAPRNLFFLAVVLVHGFRRLLPPY